MIRDPYII